jgi:Rrf2 family protein
LKITSKSRYALEALVYMGSVGGENSEPRNVKSLTEGTGIPPRYLEQILFTLRKKRIIKTKRGPRGATI